MSKEWNKCFKCLQISQIKPAANSSVKMLDTSESHRVKAMRDFKAECEKIAGAESHRVKADYHNKFLFSRYEIYVKVGKQINSSAKMLRMKLEALEHPTPNDLDLNDRKVFASTVLWLEDQKIRQYKIEDREILRKVEQLPVWEEGYVQYKSDLGMPRFTSPMEEISWLLGYAVRLEFLDAPDNFKDINAQAIGEQNSKSIKPSIEAQNFYDNMDFQHKDFIVGVRALAAKLNLPHHPDHLIQLEAIARIVHERLSPAAKNLEAVVGTPFPFEQGNDVVAANDTALDYPVRILRLLQIQSLRQLQTHINETIVSVQDLTANPKTDTKLGKVGR